MMYLDNFGSPRIEISSYSNFFNNISNPTILIKIGFSNAELCQISHDDLSIDWFSRMNLYDIPWVTVSTLGSNIDTQKTTVHPLSVNSYENLIWFSERKL